MSDAVLLLQFVGLVLEGSPIDGKLSGSVYDTSKNPELILTAISIVLFTTVGLLLVLYMHHSWGVVGTVLAHSQVARHTMRSIMLTSWVLLPWMMMEYFTGTRAMEDDVQHVRLFTLFQDAYSPQVTKGYVEWGSFLAILLLEAPFLFVFFLRKSTDLQNRKQQLSKTDCRLCYWIRVLYDTLGAMGVVAAAQIISIYYFHWALFFTVSPIFTIALVLDSLACIVSFLVCTTLLLEMVSSCSKSCSCVKIIKRLAFLLLALLGIGINYYAVTQVREDKQSDVSGIKGVLTSLVSSFIIGVYGFVVKKLLYEKKENAERENLESRPLMQEAPSP